MNLKEYKKTIKHPILPRTVTFLIRNDEVLLVLKKRGFGKGNYLGVGGKVEKNKDKKHINENALSIAKNAASREIFEEIDIIVTPEDLIPMANLKFYFPHMKDESWNQEVYAFITQKWQRDPIAKKDKNGQIEVEPEWRKKTALPLDKMWDDARYWLPEILNDKKLQAEFLFDENLKVTDHTINFKP